MSLTNTADNFGCFARGYVGACDCEGRHVCDCPDTSRTHEWSPDEPRDRVDEARENHVKMKPTSFLQAALWLAQNQTVTKLDSFNICLKLQIIFKILFVLNLDVLWPSEI